MPELPEIDEQSRKRILTLHPANRESAIIGFVSAKAAMQGRNSLLITYAFRSIEKQDELWRIGRDARGSVIGRTVTNAPGGASYHNYGLAIDFCLMHDGKASWNTMEDMDEDGIADWMEVVRIYKSLGWEWGGDWNSFKDRPHLQMIHGLHWTELRRRLKAGRVDAEGYVTLK